MLLYDGLQPHTRALAVSITRIWEFALLLSRLHEQDEPVELVWTSVCVHPNISVCTGSAMRALINFCWVAWLHRFTVKAPQRKIVQ